MITGTWVLLALIVVVALWTVQTSILRAAIGLALVSVLLTLLMFQMGAPLAGVFELSVCAGLITVVFVSAISMTRKASREQEAQESRERAWRFRPAIVVAACVGALLWIGGYALDVTPPPPEAGETVRQVLWGARRMDLLGQIIIILVGVYAVVILFKERRKETSP